jgi:hypothetical protein
LEEDTGRGNQGQENSNHKIIVYPSRGTAAALASDRELLISRCGWMMATDRSS